jgi:hypothetical protein
MRSFSGLVYQWRGRSMESRLARTCCLLLLAVAGSCPKIAGAGEWLYRIYGYRPRVYGYAPSEYVYPRYGFQRGYVYVEGPPYGSPELGPPALCREPRLLSPDLPMPGAQIDAVNGAVLPAPAGNTSLEGPTLRSGAAEPPKTRTGRQAVRVRPAPRNGATSSMSLKLPAE